jgi:hypothetical protein
MRRWTVTWSLFCFRAMMVTATDSRKEQPMATSLYDLSVPTFLQTVTAVAGFLDRAAAHCEPPDARRTSPAPSDGRATIASNS